MNSERLPIGFKALPMSSGHLPTASEWLPMNAELLPTSSEGLPMASEALSTSFEALPTGFECLPTGFECLPMASKPPITFAPLPMDAEGLPTGVECLEIMTEATGTENYPPKLRKTAEGDIDINSLADLLEWFLNYDQRVAIVRHPQVEELYQWKQKDDAAHDIEVYPFENAEARFAVGAFQALAENNTEEKLARWITDVLQALGDAKQTNEDIAAEYKLDSSKSHVEEAQKIPTNTERRLYLTSCWVEALCTAEVRFLGWVYQELYGKPFQPVTI